MMNESQAVDEPTSVITASLSNLLMDVKIWPMFDDLKQSGVICLTSEPLRGVVAILHEQTRISYSRICTWPKMRVSLYNSLHPSIALYSFCLRYAMYPGAML